MKDLFFTPRLAYVLVGIVVVFITGFWANILFVFARILFFLFIGYCVFEIMVLFSNREGIIAERTVPNKFSNGDKNPVTISFESRYNFDAHLLIFDELPAQFQSRDTHWERTIKQREQQLLTYHVRPVKRGDYTYGSVVILASTLLHLFRRRYRFDQAATAKVYPSFLHLKKYELLAFGNIRRVGQVIVSKKLGHGMEFEQIKDYVQGDPQRWLNWKATAKRQSLMVNQYTDELSKDIWCFVDKGRLMRMPFEGMSLLDYAINAALAVSHIALKSGDHVGLLTFSNKLSSMILPSKRSGQINTIMNALYSQRTHYMDSNYGLMTKYIKTKIRRRSLLLLFTNYETTHAFRRQLKDLRRLVRDHVVVVFFFENTEVSDLISKPATGLKAIYNKAIAEESQMSKASMLAEMKAAGIFAMMVKPENLSLKSVNKFLEIKSRGLI